MATEAKIKLGVDAREGESNIQRFHRTFKATLAEIGAEPGDIAFFARLDKDIQSGRVGLDEFDSKTQALLRTFREGAQVAAARDFLGVPAHADIQAEIQKTRDAYEALKNSGTLTGAELAQAAQATEDRIAELTKRTYDWKGALSDMKGELAVAGAAVYGVVKSFDAAAGASSQFQQSIAEIGTLLDDTSGLDGMAGAVRRLSREYGGEVGKNAAALYDIISAGATDSAQALGALEAANKLAIGGVTDVSVAADGLTSALNAYGAAAGSASDVSDAFFTAVRAGKTTVSELSGSIGTVAPVAAAAGVSLEQLLAATAALTAGGLGTSEAMTAIRGALTSVIKPTSEARKLAEELGLEFSASALKAQGLAGFLESVRKATGGNVETMGKLFGSVEGLNGVLTLTGAGADKFAETLAAMGAKAGETDKAVAKMMDGPAARAARFSAAMADIQLSVGDAVTAFSPLLESVTDLLNGFNDLNPATKTLIAGTGALAVALPPLVIAMGSLAKAAGILRTALVIGTAAKAADTAATMAQTAATDAATAAVVRKTAALRLLRLAMVGTGVGALVVGAGALAEKLLDSADASETLAGSLPDAQDARAVAALTANAAQLADAMQDAADAMQDAAGAASANKAAIQELVEAMAKLGLNLAEVDAAFDETEKNALAAFDEIAGNAAATADVLIASLLTALDRVSGDAGFENLRKAAGRAFDAGRLSADQYAVALDAIATKQAGLWQGMDRTTEAVDQLGDAYRRLGIVSKAELEATERQRRKDYELIVASGAAIQDQAAAWAKWAESAIAANGGVATATMQSEAAMRNYTIAVDEAGNAQIRLKQAVEASSREAEAAAAVAIQSAEDAALAQALAWDRAGRGIGNVKDRITDFYAHITALGDGLAAHINFTRQATFDAVNGSVEAMKLFEAAAKEGAARVMNIGGVIEAYYKSMDFVIGRYAEQTQHAAAMTEALQQRIDETAGAVDRSSNSLADQIKLVEQTMDRVNLLGDQDLEPLRRALDDAKSRMRALRDEASDTLATIQDEWDRLNNNLGEIERRRAAKREAELKVQLAAAQAAGDREAIANLEKALRLLKQINAENIKAAREEEKSSRNRDSGGGTTYTGDRTGGAARTGGATPTPTPATAGGVHFHIGGILDVNDRSTLDTLARKLRPVFSDLERKGF